jgi:hypothetical protein
MTAPPELFGGAEHGGKNENHYSKKILDSSSTGMLVE